MIPDLLFLANFRQLSELHLWGGQFYADNIHAAVAEIGDRLQVLYLIHTEQMDAAALQLIAHVCPHLRTLGFYNCEFVSRQQPSSSAAEDDVVAAAAAVAPLRRELELLLEVEQLEVVSECSEDLLRLLLASVLNVETLKTGIHCQITDATVSTILATNALQHLKVRLWSN